MIETKTLLDAIERLRRELPTLVGLDWPGFEAQLNRYLQQLDEDDRRALVIHAKILKLFGDYPEAHARLVVLLARYGEEAPLLRDVQSSGEEETILDDETAPHPDVETEPESQRAQPKAVANGGDEKRRVQARIRHAGRQRNSFVAGGENVIRCWIGLPEPDAAVADTPIPRVEIPEVGLPLDVELLWNDQADRKQILLPRDRTARTGDCDLHLVVPEEEHFVSADVVFRFRGRVFEAVRVEAYARSPEAPEEPDDEVRVRVQVGRREVIELGDSTEYDGVFLFGDDSASGVVRVFSDGDPRRFDLSDADTAVKWLNEELFHSESTLVRQRARQGVTTSTLDAEHKDVLRILRDLARHGATLYNQLQDQGFRDPGTRVQLLNLEAKEYVPLEFVYDRGFPSDRAKLCGGWQRALDSDETLCPACKPAAELTLQERDRSDVICPLGFWSLQKIIERIDPPKPSEDDALTSTPRTDRRTLPAIKNVVFASSSKVPEGEREATAVALNEQFKQGTVVVARDWGEWKAALSNHPSLLLALPHHGVEHQLDYLEVGGDDRPAADRRLSRGQLTDLYVNPKRIEPGPIVILMGCQTGIATETGYVQLARRFHQLHTSIVMGTLAKILGRHAAPVARELVGQLAAVTDSEADFGTIMRRVRRRMLLKGYLMSLCLVALGDAEWRLTPSRSEQRNP